VLAVSFGPYQFSRRHHHPKRVDTATERGVGAHSTSAETHGVRKYRLLWATPFLSTVVAFACYNELSVNFHALIQEISTHITHSYVPHTPEEIDLQTQVITQVINGPVITSVSVLFATLVSTTISTLHNRQSDVLRSLTKQLEGLQILEMINQDKRLKCFVASMKVLYIHQENAVANWTEIDAVLAQMLRYLQTVKQVESYAIVRDMHQERSQQRVSLQRAFPGIHYLTLSILAFSISLSFLIATDQSLSILGSLQCRILWSILVGAFTSLGVLCYDLSSPFMGAYQVNDFLGKAD
jgi:Protein of unknown function (DUF4239)